MKNTIRRVGAYELKTHLAELLTQVEKGQEIIVTKRERPIARLIPIQSTVNKKEIFDRIRAFHARMRPLPKGETTMDLIEAGRRM